MTGFITCGFTSILAIVFGHVSLGQIRRDGTDGRGMAIGGVALGWILTGVWVLFWALSWTGVLSTALYAAANPTVSAGPERSRLDLGPQPDDVAHVVEFEAVGTDGATSAGNVTYSQDSSIKQEKGVPFPYSKMTTFEGEQPRLYLWVQNAGAKGTIACRITINGEVVREATVDTPYGVCTVTVDKP